MVCDKVVCQKWWVTKLCVKDGVSKMVSEKDAVPKMVSERSCVTKWCVKDGV